MRKNWSGNVIFQENEYLEPKSVGELQEMIKSRSHIHVRGSGHSFNSIADSTKSIVNLASIPQVIEIDEAKRCVKVSSSLKYGEIVETIESKGWAISNLASLPHISIGGSIATATHGSGIKNRNLASQVSAFEYIDSSGNIHHVEENHRDFNALLIGLGVAGIVTYYWLKLEPSFKVRQIIYENLSENELENSFNQIMSTAYSVSFLLSGIKLKEEISGVNLERMNPYPKKLLWPQKLLENYTQSLKWILKLQQNNLENLDYGSSV